MDEDITPPQPFLRFFRLPAAAYEQVRASLDAHYGLTKESTAASGQIVKVETALPPIEQAVTDQDGNAYVCLNAWHITDPIVGQTVKTLLAANVATEVSESDYQALLPQPAELE